MKQIQQILLPTSVWTLLISVINAVILYGAAILIQAGTVELSSSEIFILLSVILSVSIGCYFAARKNASPKSVMLLAVSYYGILVLLSFLLQKATISYSMLVKLMVCTFVGFLIGNLFGGKAHSKLKKSPKKRSRTTK